MSLLNFTILLAIILKQCSSCCGDDSGRQEDTISQPIDHSNYDGGSFAMRYVYFKDYWEKDGPLIIYLEGACTAAAPNRAMFMADLARNTNGAIFILQHRYCGENIDDLMDLGGIKHLKYQYLTVKQVLADIRNFIEVIKKSDEFEESKTIVIGESYAGRLAAWARLKYPELVDVAIAVDAPMKNVMEYPQFYDAVARIYNEFGGYRCLRAIQEKMKFENYLFRNNGEEYIKKEKRFCSRVNISSEEQQKQYRETVLSMISSPVVTFDELEIKEQCRKINNLEGSINKFSTIPQRIYWSQIALHHTTPPPHTAPHTARRSCFSHAFAMSELKETPYDYMRCAQLGQYATSSDDRLLPFNVTLDFYLDKCAFLYGDHFNMKTLRAALDELNEEYGGMKPNVSHVVFVNGGLNPWHPLGILEDLSEDAPAVFIPRAAKGDFIYANQRDDDFEIIEDARNKIVEIVKDWIGIDEEYSSGREGWSFFKSFW